MEEDKYVVYGKANCPNCVKVVEVLNRFHKEYLYIDVEQDDEALKFIKSIGAKSVPQVFYEGFLVGGYDETVKHIFTK